jgi:hypothetical protein
MSLSNQKNNPSLDLDFSNLSGNEVLVPARVYSCISDADHPYYKGPDTLGTIFYGKINLNESKNPNLDKLNRARPLFGWMKRYPLQNEIVLLLNTTSRNIYKQLKGDNAFTSTYYFPEISIWNNSHHNALPAEGASDTSLGEYYKEGENTQGLFPFEGDTIFEGRANKQGLQMGSSTPRGKNNYSENDSEGDPVTILSGGSKNTNLGPADINDLYASLWLTSNQNINNFVVASDNVQTVGTTFTQPSAGPVIVDPVPNEVTETEAPLQDFTPSNVVASEDDTEEIEEIAPPFEPEVLEELDDPIFNLIEEGIEEGTIQRLDPPTYYETAGTAATPGTADGDIDGRDIIENFDFGTGGNNTNPSHQAPPNNSRSTDAKADWPKDNNNKRSLHKVADPTKRPVVYLTNRVGDQIKVGPALSFPLPASHGIKKSSGNRDIQYICIHTSAGNQTRMPIDTMAYFLDPGEWRWTEPKYRKDGTLKKKGYWGWEGGRYWKHGGYHWMIEATGHATRLADDSVRMNGAGNLNDHAIHLNWIGGHEYNNITQQQISTLKKLCVAYANAYPDARFLGHNQQTAKECPWFYVPSFMKGIGYKPDRMVHGFSRKDALQDKDGKVIGDLPLGDKHKMRLDKGMSAAGSSAIQQWKDDGAIMAENQGTKFKKYKI